MSGHNKSSRQKSRPFNVSIPADLRDEMDQWPVNWSRIFSEAARKKIEVFKAIEKAQQDESDVP